MNETLHHHHIYLFISIPVNFSCCESIKLYAALNIFFFQITCEVSPFLRAFICLGSFCKRRMDGKLHRDPSDCTAYIYCSGGYAYRARCDEGLYYDHKLQACNYNNGQCAGTNFNTLTTEIYQNNICLKKYGDVKNYHYNLTTLRGCLWKLNKTEL